MTPKSFGHFEKAEETIKQFAHRLAKETYMELKNFYAWEPAIYEAKDTITGQTFLYGGWAAVCTRDSLNLSTLHNWQRQAEEEGVCLDDVDMNIHADGDRCKLEAVFCLSAHIEES